MPESGLKHCKKRIEKPRGCSQTISGVTVAVDANDDRPVLPHCLKYSGIPSFLSLPAKDWKTGHPFIFEKINSGLLPPVAGYCWKSRIHNCLIFMPLSRCTSACQEVSQTIGCAVHSSSHNWWRSRHNKSSAHYTGLDFTPALLLN